MTHEERMIRTKFACLLAVGLLVPCPVIAQEPAPPAEDASKASSDSLEKIFPIADSPDFGHVLIGKVFALIGGLQRIGDLTRERVEQELDVRFYAREDAHMPVPGTADYTWNQRLSSDWWMVGMNLEKANEAGRPELGLVFLNLKNRGAAMTPACADLYEFAGAMTKKYGYAGKALGTDEQHIRSLEFVRTGVADSPVVEIYPAHELPETPMEGRTCIKQIVIH